MVGKYILLLSLLATVAWFFWNPEGWKFEWEPVVVFLASLAFYIGLDVRQYKSHRQGDAPNVHPEDVKLLRELRRLLPSTNSISFLKEHDFLASFDRDEIQPIRKFVETWNNAEHTFIDPEIERLRSQLLDACREFSLLVSKYTSPNSVGLQAVVSERLMHDSGHEKRFKCEAQELNDKADTVVAAHQELMKRGREKLLIGECEEN